MCSVGNTSLSLRTLRSNLPRPNISQTKGGARSRNTDSPARERRLTSPTPARCSSASRAGRSTSPAGRQALMAHPERCALARWRGCSLAHTCGAQSPDSNSVAGRLELYLLKARRTEQGLSAPGSGGLHSRDTIPFFCASPSSVRALLSGTPTRRAPLWPSLISPHQSSPRERSVVFSPHFPSPPAGLFKRQRHRPGRRLRP